MLLGIGIKEIFIPIFLLYILANLATIVNNSILERHNKNKITIFFLAILFITSTFILSNNPPNEISLNLFINIVYHIITISIIIQKRSQEDCMKLYIYFLVGLFVHQITIVLYSYMVDPVAYGYGLLLSPFNEKEMNSPDVSNAIAICAILFVYFAAISKNFFLKKISIVLILLSIIAGIYLGGRAYFIILILTIIVFSFSKSWRDRGLNKRALVIATIAAGIATQILTTIDSELKYSIELVLYRFNVIEEMTGMKANPFYETGLQSGRFDLLAHGFKNIINHPFGGFKPYEAIETNWYHNIVLDVARLSGWIPLLFLFSQFAIHLTIILRTDNRHEILVKWMPTAILIIMMQSIPIEGEFRIYIAYLISLYILATKTKSKINNGYVALNGAPRQTSDV